MPFEQGFPRPFRPMAIQSYAPAMSGVYGISNGREWIYIGETDNIQGALFRHVQESDTALQRHEPTGFVFEIVDRARRTARQDRLVSEYGPACNRNG